MQAYEKSNMLICVNFTQNICKREKDYFNL